jgi:hypothetical protein
VSIPDIELISVYIGLNCSKPLRLTKVESKPKYLKYFGVKGDLIFL